MDEAVAPTGILPGQVMDALPKFAVLTRLRLIVPGGFGQAHQNTSPFGLDVRRDQLPDHGAFLSGRYRFFPMTSFIASISRRC